MTRRGVARSALAAALLAAGCSIPSELDLAIRLPSDRSLLSGVVGLELSVSRSGVTLAQASFPSTASSVALSGVSHGAATVARLDGLDTSGNVVARGLTCPVDFRGPVKAPLYFAPTNFFGPTLGSPRAERRFGLGVTVTVASALAGLEVGDVLLFGGAGADGIIAGSSERYATGSATFVDYGVPLAHPRWKAEAAFIPGVGLLITGGLDASGAALATAELYDASSNSFVSLDSGIDARVGHRVVVLSDGTALVTGGAASEGGAPLATTLSIYVRSGGAYQVSGGSALSTARRQHAAVAAGTAVVLLGGYGPGNLPLDSIEVIDTSAGGAPPRISQLSTARAEATASLLSDGTILVVGGVGASGPVATAELWNPYTQTTTPFRLLTARSGHSATVLSGDRVLIAGGSDGSGGTLPSVELYIPGIGFVGERALGTPRTGHLAYPLCDSTILMVGGAATAEVYTPPVD